MEVMGSHLTFRKRIIRTGLRNSVVGWTEGANV